MLVTSRPVGGNVCWRVEVGGEGERGRGEERSEA